MMQVCLYVQVHMMHVHNMHEWLMHVCMMQIPGILDPDTCMYDVGAHDEYIFDPQSLTACMTDA